MHRTFDRQQQQQQQQEITLESHTPTTAVYILVAIVSFEFICILVPAQQCVALLVAQGQLLADQV